VNYGNRKWLTQRKAKDAVLNTRYNLDTPAQCHKAVKPKAVEARSISLLYSYLVVEDFDPESLVVLQHAKFEPARDIRAIDINGREKQRVPC
jgi:hypothetical protein